MRPPPWSHAPQHSALGVSHAGLTDEVKLDGVLLPVADGVHQAGRALAGEVGDGLDAAVAIGFSHTGPFVLERFAADWVFCLMIFLIVCFLPVAFFMAFFRTILDPGRGTLEGATSQDSLCCRGRPGQAHCTILRPRGNG